MKNIKKNYLKIFIFFMVKFSIYLNRHVFVMESRDHRVHRAVWLQHSLSTYIILATVGYIHIYCITQTVIRLCGFIADLNLFCPYAP